MGLLKLVLKYKSDILNAKDVTFSQALVTLYSLLMIHYALHVGIEKDLTKIKQVCYHNVASSQVYKRGDGMR